MDKEEILNKYIDLIDKGYCCDCNELNCIDNFPHAKITHAIRELQQQNKILKENYERIYNENCILREKHNINDIGLLDENYKLKQIIDKAIDYLEQKPVVMVNGEPREIYVEDDNKLLDILKKVIK